MLSDPPKRRLPRTRFEVTPIAMGCWPIAGIRSVDVNEADSLATLRAALDSGINFFDTAYCYGYHGESERLIARALGTVRDEIVIASKGGIHWGPDQQQALDGRPETIRRECDESLKRLGTDRIDLHYLHAPDPKVPVAESAGAFRELIRAGKILSAGLSNSTKEQLAEFHTVCPLTAYQPPYNMLQREVESSQLPWCVANDVAAIIYWPLMKGLLAGKLPRNHVFAPNDSRRKYPMFHGVEWQKNQDFLDRLRPLAVEAGVSISQLVLNWTIHRQGVTVALCGAKRADQIRDNSGAMHFRLSERQLVRIDDAIFDRGPIVSRTPV